MPDFEELARRAGIEKAWKRYPAEVEQAIGAADRFRALYRRPTDAAVEPPAADPFHARNTGDSGR